MVYSQMIESLTFYFFPCFARLVLKLVAISVWVYVAYNMLRGF